MNSRRRAWLACAAFAAAAAPLAAGESLYVVEQVVVSLNSTADGNGERVATLKSGDRVELIERAGEAVHVRLPDGREGWLRALYVSGDEPMRPRLAQSEAEVARLKAEVSRLSAQLAAQPAPPAAAAASAPAGEAAAPSGGALFAPVGAPESHRPGVWASLAVLAGLGLGFALGWRTLDRRIRRKYGGLKIY
ncbi:MAG: SH3 domain-containing protein [Proteobacteria bacterium]|nr:SH3 domain-containing protein [Pseudomonadota bacterium]